MQHATDKQMNYIEGALRDELAPGWGIFKEFGVSKSKRSTILNVQKKFWKTEMKLHMYSDYIVQPDF